MSFSKLPKNGKQGYHQKSTSFTSNQRPRLLPSKSVGQLNLESGNLQPTVLIIQNDLLCNPCTAINSFISHDIKYQVVYAFHENAFKLLHPSLFEAMIILGGRAGVYEEPKWLKEEMKFIVNALKLNIPILGICLGCQLLAQCIGGNVYAGKKGVEIGYHKWKFIKDKDQKNIDDPKPLAMIVVQDESGNKTFTKWLKPKRRAVRSSSMDYIGDNHKIDFSSAPMKQRSKRNLNDDDPGSGDAKSEESDVDFNEDLDDLDDEWGYDLDDDDENNSVDPIVKLLQPKGYDNYIILFHGDTFSLPKQCKVSKQPVTLLATTNTYNTLFRVGKYSYGFQGHPELTYDMLRVWCKCWGDEFLNRWNGDIDKDVIKYAQKHQDVIKLVGKSIFDIWCEDVVLNTNKDQLINNLAIDLFDHDIGTDDEEDIVDTVSSPKSGKRSPRKKQIGFSPKASRANRSNSRGKQSVTSYDDDVVPYKIHARPKDDITEDEEEEYGAYKNGNNNDNEVVQSEANGDTPMSPDAISEAVGLINKAYESIKEQKENMDQRVLQKVNSVTPEIVQKGVAKVNENMPSASDTIGFIKQQKDNTKQVAKTMAKGAFSAVSYMAGSAFKAIVDTSAQNDKREDVKVDEGEGDKSDVCVEVLKDWGLTQYQHILIEDKGYDDISDWEDLEFEDLQKMGFKDGHAKRFVSKSKKYFQQK